MQSLLIVGGQCLVGIDLSSVHPENVSNMVAGSNLFLSGALGLNGQIPERLNPLERRSGFQDISQWPCAAGQQYCTC